MEACKCGCAILGRLTKDRADACACVYISGLESERGEKKKGWWIGGGGTSKGDKGPLRKDVSNIFRFFYPLLSLANSTLTP